MSKWGKSFWADTAERVGTTAVGGALTILTTDSAFHYSTAAIVSVVAIPSATSFLKCLLANLSGSSATASIVGVTSNQQSAPVAPAADDFPAPGA